MHDQLKKITSVFIVSLEIRLSSRLLYKEPLQSYSLNGKFTSYNGYAIGVYPLPKWVGQILSNSGCLRGE